MKALITYITEAVENKKEFVVIKPEFTHLKNDIIKFLLDRGIMVKNELTRVLSKDDARLLYSPHKKEPFYKDLVEYMCGGESIGLMCVNFGGKNMDDIKEEARKKWGKGEMKNCLHSSDSSANVARESKIYFRKKEEV